MTAARNPIDEPERDTQLPSVEQVPPHPWTGPSPQAQAAAEPAKEAVREALTEIKTPEQADQVAAEAAAAAGGTTELQIREEGGAAPDPAQAIQAAAATTPGVLRAEATLVETAKQVAGSAGETREALELAIQEVTNPEQRGVEEPELRRPLTLLRGAILKQMKPHQAVDVRLFLLINHLPHTRITNQLMSFVTMVMNGGFGWIAGLVVAALIDHKRGRQALVQIVPPLWFATMTVEYPVKYYFRRRRPFIDVVQAIAVGRKPGSYSFPSGHSAAAFAGAWLLRRHFPRLAPLWFGIAGIVGFSRMYLGAHYPGDVLSGALAGTAIAEATRWVLDKADDFEEVDLK
jgi:undecaprenyl-diphosphatase